MSRKLQRWLRSAQHRFTRQGRQSDQERIVESYFHRADYQHLTARTLEHLASLGLPLRSRSVLEVGAGAGDYSSFFLDRSCRVTITEVRSELLAYLQRRYPQHDIRRLDLEQPKPLAGAPFEIVFCYGVLYHLRHPDDTLAYLGAHCSDLLLVSTQVIFGNESRIVEVDEPQERLPQAYHGHGSRFTRRWLREQLLRQFPYVYTPITQPVHPQFPCDWTTPPDHDTLVRANFVAARRPLTNPLLTEAWLDRQEHQP